MEEHASVYYIERKPKKLKRGRPGNEATKLASQARIVTSSYSYLVSQAISFAERGRVWSHCNYQVVTKSADLIGHITFLPWRQLDGCSMTRPFLSLRRVWLARLIVTLSQETELHSPGTALQLPVLQSMPLPPACHRQEHQYISPI